MWTVLSSDTHIRNILKFELKKNIDYFRNYRSNLFDLLLLWIYDYILEMNLVVNETTSLVFMLLKLS